MIKFATMGDIHLIERKPKYRKDNTKQAVMDKFVWILEEACKEKCSVFFIPGDLFDSWKVQDKFITMVNRILVEYIDSIQIVVVPGQHDLRYHMKGLDNTPMGILASAGLIQIASWQYPIEFDGFNVWGIGFGEDKYLNELQYSENDILLIHTMITDGKPLWPGQANWSGAKAFMRKHNFKYILSGDNHNRIITKIGDRVLINSGSLLRKTKLQLNYSPTLTIVDYSSCVISEHLVPLSPSEEVFNLDQIKVDASKQKSEISMDKLLETIRLKNQDVNPMYILQDVIDKEQPSDNVKFIIEDIMEKNN